MRKLIIIILGLFSVAYGQKYQSMPQAGYGPVKRIQHDSVLTIPMGIERLRNLSDGRDSGQVRYNPSDSSLYVYTGRTWVKCGRSELTALAPLYAYNDTTIAIDTTSSEGVATKWDLSQVGGGGTDTALIRTIISDSINSYGTFLTDRIINAATHNLTFDSLFNYYVYAKDYDGDSNGNINLESTSFDGSLLSGIGIMPSGIGLSTTNATNNNSVSISTSFVQIVSEAASEQSKIVTTKDSVVITTDTLRLSLPSAGNGKVLTSDANGTATWQTITDIDNEPIINAMQALGSTYKSTTVGVDVSKIAAAQAINANTVYYMVTWIPNDTTLTGVSWYQTVQGVYTASGYNGVGLYSYSGGTWTLVASSTDDGEIWKATANTYPTKAFSSTYRATRGVYAIAINYNRSIVTTAPTIARGGVLTNAAVSSIGTNSAKLYSSSSGSSLPSSIAASSQSTVNTPFFLALY